SGHCDDDRDDSAPMQRVRRERAAPSTRFGAARTSYNNDKGRAPMMDSNRRTILTTGAAVAATAAVPQVFAQEGGPGGGATSFYEKGNVRIRYQEIGSGFPSRTTSAASQWISVTLA